MSEGRKAASGFDLTKITLKGFLLYKRECSIDFIGKTAIVGPTGSGKTTWVDGLTYALYKRNSRTGTVMEDIIDLGGYIIVEFTKDGINYIVKRGRNITGGSYMHLTIDGERFKGGIQASEMELHSIMGMDFNAFSSSCLVRQREMIEFTGLSGAERVKRLQHLFRLQIFDKALKETRERSRKLQRESDVLKGRSDAMKEMLSREPAIKNEIKEKESEMAIAITERGSLKEKQAKMKEEIDRMRLEREKNITLETRKDALVKKVDQLKVDVGKVERSVTSLHEMVTSDEGRKPERRALNERKEAANKIEELDRERIGLEESVNTRNSLSSEQEKQFESVLERHAGGITIDQYTEIVVQHSKNITSISSGKSDKKALNESLKMIEKGKEKCMDWAFSTIFKKEMSFKAMVESIEEKLRAIKEDIERRRTEIDGKSREDILAEMELLSSIESTISKNKEMLEDKRKQRAELQAQLSESSVELMGVQDSISSKEPLWKTLSIKEATLSVMDADISDADSKIGRIRGNLEGSRKNLTEIEDYRKNASQNDAKLASIDKEMRLLSLIEKQVFHGGALPLFAVRSIIDTVSIRASQFLEELTGGQWNKIEFISYSEGGEKRKDGSEKAGVQYGFKILVDGREARTFSGGEMTQINAAIRFALSEKLRVKFIFIDEGDLGSLDTEVARDRFIDVLLSLNREMKVAFITHMQETAQGFDQIIRVEKRSGFSTVSRASSSY